MGLFDNPDKNSDNEVRISAPEKNEERTSSEEKSSNRLKSEVRSEVGSRNSSDRRKQRSRSSNSRERSSRSSDSFSSGSVDLEDIYEQNKRIIELLEQISDEESSDHRVTDRGRDENDSSSDIGSGMNELL